MSHLKQYYGMVAGFVLFWFGFCNEKVKGMIKWLEDEVTEGEQIKTLQDQVLERTK